MAEVSIEVGANKEICEVVLFSQLTEEDAIIDSDVPFFNDVGVVTHFIYIIYIYIYFFFNCNKTYTLFIFQM